MRTAPLPDASSAAARTEAAARAARVFERHGRMVYGICRAILRDPHDAEDATQQTFFSAYRSLLGGAHVRDEGAWLATIARNECRTRIAAGMRRPLSVGDEVLAAIPATGDEAERRAQAEALRVALSELPERQREAVVLRHLYGLSYGEVARALGLSRPATEALLFRARRAMRARMRPVVATAIAVPLAVQESLAQAIPGFGAAGAGVFVGGAATGGLMAKLASAPVAAKMATAAVAVTTVGTVGTIESERAGRDRAERSGLVTTVDQRAASDDSPSGDDGQRDPSRGPGSGEDEDYLDDDNSGPGSASRGSTDYDAGQRELEDDSGSSGEGSEDDADRSGSSGDAESDSSGGGHGGETSSSGSSESSGSGSGGSGSGESGSGDGGASRSDGSSSESSGSESSGSESSGSSHDDADDLSD